MLRNDLDLLQAAAAAACGGNWLARKIMARALIYFKALSPHDTIMEKRPSHDYR